ncbi:AAA family ATPase [Paenimyroides ceti]|uniref:AAA family ATPase n=1 Tax=Paenimyroides ceti TaxID=395087 RepID=UPI0037C78464
MDEIDAIGRARGKSNFSGSNDETRKHSESAFKEMDGFGTNTNVIVLAATNRAEILDSALMRAGRLTDRFMLNYQMFVKENKSLKYTCVKLKKLTILILTS